MKNYILLFVFSVYSQADLSVAEIRDMVMKIHEKRDGISLKKLQKTLEPFVRLVEENNTTTFEMPEKQDKISLSLHSIMNNRAFINGRWLGIDDIIGGYTLKYIGNYGVVLRNDTEVKKLFLMKQKDSFIKISEKE